MTIIIDETTDSLINNRIIAYDENEEGEIQVEFTYNGTEPTGVDYQLIRTDTSAIVQIDGEDWTAGTSFSTSGGNGQINCPNLPKTNSMLQIKIRKANVITETDQMSNEFGVGFVIDCLGQSYMVYWFAWPDTGNVHDLVKVFNHNGVAPFDTNEWVDGYGIGAEYIGNTIQSVLECPVGLIHYAVNGSGLLYESAPTNCWLNSARTDLYSRGVNWEEGKDIQEPLERIKANIVIWIQGFQDCHAGVTKANYKDGSEVIYSFFASVNNHTNIPIFINGLSRMCITYGDDAGANAVRWAEMELVEENDNVFLGATVIELGTTNCHFWGTSTYVACQRTTQAVLTEVLGTGSYTYYRGPKAEYWFQQNSSTTRVWLNLNSEATAIAPITGIDSFEVYNGSSWISATGALVKYVGLDGYTEKYAILDLTHASETITDIRCLWGKTPATIYIPKDNTSFTLPLEVVEEITNEEPVLYSIGGKSKLMNGSIKNGRLAA